MSKIQIHAILKNVTEKNEHIINTKGIYHDGCITYQDGEIQMILKIKKDQIEMIRFQNEDRLVYRFIYPLTTVGIYDIKSVNMTFDVTIHTTKLVIQKNKIEIAYEMTLSNEPTKAFYYQLEYEVIP